MEETKGESLSNNSDTIYKQFWLPIGECTITGSIENFVITINAQGKRYIFEADGRHIKSIRTDVKAKKIIYGDNNG